MNYQHANSDAFAASASQQLKSTPRMGLCDVTNVSTATRRELFHSLKPEKEPSIPTFSFSEHVNENDTKSDSDEEYPPVEFFHREPVRSSKELFKILIADELKKFPDALRPETAVMAPLLLPGEQL